MQAAAGSCGPAHTASKLRQLSARPKRSLGQNFCTSDAVLEARRAHWRHKDPCLCLDTPVKGSHRRIVNLGCCLQAIVNAANISDGDHVLEIGPGDVCSVPP